MKFKLFLCAIACAASAYADVTVQNVRDYFILTVTKPDNYHYLWFWLGANEGVGNLPEEDAVIENQCLDGGITPLQIAAYIGSRDWLNFLLESGQKPFTEIIVLREKIEYACNTKTIPEFTPNDKLHLNQPLNAEGQTPLDLAAQVEHFDLIEQLKKHGAHDKKPDIDEIIKLEYLKKYCNKESFEEFLEWRSEKKAADAHVAAAERETK